MIALVLTRGFWNNRCEPLLGLGVETWENALQLGLINQIEFNVCTRQTGQKIPTLAEFNQIQSGQLSNLRAIAH